MIGPPGAGKTMLARRLPGILPPLSFDEAIEATTIHSVAGQLRPGVGLLVDRPFRAPHHTISDAALVGGGTIPRPGEVSLAHHGVLFLDEMPEFDRRVLEALRQPIEEGRITVSRALRSVAFPARFVLVAAMNPCPCGYHGDDKRVCRCTPQQIAKYGGRLSGPLRDRLDLIVEVESVPISALTQGPPGEPSAAVRARVLAARERQTSRPTRARVNAQLTGTELKKCAALDKAGRSAAGTIGGTPPPLGARVSPGHPRRAHDCRPGRRRCDRARSPRRGPAIPLRRRTLVARYPDQRRR